MTDLTYLKWYLVWVPKGKMVNTGNSGHKHNYTIHSLVDWYAFQNWSISKAVTQVIANQVYV